MDHVREELQLGQHLQQGARKENRSRIVVAEADDPVAVEKLRAVDEVHDHIAEPSFVDRRLQLLGAERHLQARDDRTQVVPPDVDLPVARKHDPDIVAHLAQLLRERRRDVRDATELGKGRELRRRDQHLEVL